ncbi:MAG: hypothetical protein IIX86_05660 [Clostridia bacterium]|nr:hypothetical protein [Clostridia bacterium]
MIHAGAVKAWLLRVAAAVMVLLTLFGVFGITAYAVDNGSSFDQTNVLEDLLTSTVNGKPFDLRAYPFREDGEVQVISMIEYCYSYKGNQRENYGLYLYVYNPKGLNLSTDSKRNKVQMAVSYNKDGNPDAYEKFSLEFCSKVESGDYKNLFYKYKVIDRKIGGETFDQRVNSNERRYDISGIELTTHGSDTATEYHVGTSYRYTGYAAGYGPNSGDISTLHCEIEKLETISLSVKHTFYRSESSSLGAGHQNQLDTVYFTIPVRYLEEYGKLQRIKAEWYEYKTKEILVTSHAAFFGAAYPYAGIPLGTTPNAYGQYEYVEDIGYSLAIGAGNAGGTNMAQWGWNLGTGYLHAPTNVLYYMFYVDDIKENDPYSKKVNVGGIESNELYEYIRRYNKTFASGRLPIKSGTISADLFEADIDESRKLNNAGGKIQMGYSYYDFDADLDVQVLSSWSESNPSIWDNWHNFGLGAVFTGGPDEASRVVAPIQILQPSDLSGTDKEIAQRLLISTKDVDSLKTMYSDAITVSGANDEEQAVVLFRFATSDYYSRAVDIIQPDAGFLGGDKKFKEQAYIAQESVFFDFDIIQLTFNKDEVYTVIPVVSDPIDVINDISTPIVIPQTVEWWQVVFALAMLVLLILLLAPIWPYILQAILWVYDYIAKGVRAVAQLIRKRKAQNDKEE